MKKRYSCRGTIKLDVDRENFKYRYFSIISIISEDYFEAAHETFSKDLSALLAGMDAKYGGKLEHSSYSIEKIEEENIND